MEIITSLKSFWGFFNQDRKRRFFILASGMAFLAILEASAPLMIAIYFKPELLVSLIDIDGEFDNIKMLKSILPWLVLVVFCVKTGFGFFMSVHVNHFCFDFQADIGKRVLAAYLNMPFDRFRAIKSGDILRNIVNEPSQITFNISLPFLSFIAETFVLVAMVLVALYISPVTIITISVIFSLVIWFTYSQSVRRINNYSKIRHDEDATRMLMVNNSILGFLDIRFGDATLLTCEEYHKHAARSARAEAAQQTISLLPRYSLELSLVLLLLVVIVGDVALTDSLYIATAFLAIGYRLLPTLNRITTAIHLFRYGLPAINSLSKIVADNCNDNLITDIQQNNLKSIDLHLVTKNRPDTNELLFPAVNIELNKGKIYAISGPSGVGKSTLLHVISGMLPADAGNVIFKTDTGLVKDRKLFSQYIGYLDQAPYIAETFLSKNLMISISEMQSRQDIVILLNKIGLNGLSDAISQGKDPLLGRGGIHLSGGEKQRFALVKALLQKKSVLLLDEPTAGLDAYSEKKFIELLREVRSEYLIVLISHSISVVQSADEIIDLSLNSANI